MLMCSVWLDLRTTANSVLIALDPNVAPTFVWDMARNRKHGDIPYEAWPVGPDLDGKPMILAWSGPDHHGLKLIDAESLAARAALTIREDPLTVEQRPYYNRGNLFLNTNPGLHVYDFATATVRFEIPETYFQAFSSPDGRLLFAHQGIFGETLLELLAARLGYKLSSPPSGRDEYSLYSNVTGEKLTPLFTCDWGSRVPWWWLTQQGTLATGDATDDHILHIWDIHRANRCPGSPPARRCSRCRTRFWHGGGTDD